MKTSKLVLSVFAFVLGISGAFASRMFTPVIGYEQVPPGSSAPINCQARKQCSDIPNPRCTFNGVSLWKMNATNTACDLVVYDKQL